MGLFSFLKKKEPHNEEISLDVIEELVSESGQIDVNIDYIPIDDAAQTKEEGLKFAKNCCEQMLECNQRIEETKREYHLVNGYIADIQIIETLPESERKILTAIAKKAIVLDRDKEAFRNSSESISGRQFSLIHSLEAEMPQIIKKMSEDEQYCQMVKVDMKYLEGEINALKLEKRELKNRLRFLQGMAKIAAVSLSILILTFIILGFSGTMDMGFNTYVLVAVSIFVAAGVFFIHNHTTYSIKMNDAKMNKAIGMINKVKIKYVNITGGLEYSYEKYKVQNVYELSKFWGQYQKAKQKKEVYRRATAKLYETNEEIITLLEKFKLNDASVWISQAEALIDKSIMSDINQNLLKRRQKIKETLVYYSDIIERNQNSIKELVLSNKEYADEILAIVDQYS